MDDRIHPRFKRIMHGPAKSHNQNRVRVTGFAGQLFQLARVDVLLP